ncbi:hypothetical protein PVL29_023535 [Vitis rotundifolia]|uniref:Uncharacterized protein n=1 Tax=Vitis rotundifolia TaxID=103349 RepID=A0AA38YPC9_VITRO|nr:hypothetical protein PVL29_023535 [Vitis rotundifolia]
MNYWFLTDLTICSLSELFCKLPYILKDEMVWNLLSRATVCASRFGWVLFGKRVYVIVKVTFYYVYNPVTKEIVSLLRFKWQQGQKHKYLWENQATFSSAATSPDCVCFACFKTIVMPNICNREQIFISTYSSGDTTWKTRNITLLLISFHISFGFPTDPHVVGALSSFNVATQEWRLLTKHHWRNCRALFLDKFLFGVSTREQTKMVVNRVYYFSQ